jgi:NADPH-dependent curcumin reductase
MSLPKTHRRVVLANRPNGMASPDNFRLEEAPLPEPQPGQVLVRQIVMSLDPYMRGRMNAVAGYAANVEIDAVMTGGGVGEVVQSLHPDFKVGDIVEGTLGWQEYSLPPLERLRVIDPAIAPISTANGVLGMPGMTAYFGLLHVGEPKPGETVVVSAASGAVGAIVGQIAKIMGCHVVGIAGSPAKCAYVVDELGFDACINYKTDDLDAGLQKHCPGGVDVYFESVGGAVYDAITRNLALGARIAVCGGIAEYNLVEPELVPRNTRFFIPMRARMQGFLVYDFHHLWPEALPRMGKWISEGKINYREDFVDGLENAPDAFMKLFQGENFGKLLVRVGDDPAV